ncbi:hypothetical protein [Micromonospora profundi]|uniref:hypothetical protein n=1 Tax=Micromonospora profundi TaxID=1420889 RepID=UPI0036528D6A
MRPPVEYVAQSPIFVNGVRAYNPGDDVPSSAVENLGLKVGADVRPAHAGVIERPAKNGLRSEWEAYWLGQGLPQADIDGMTRDELAAKEPEVIAADPDPSQAVHVNPNPAPDAVAEQATEQTSGPVAVVERPAANARKADWVEYAAFRGMSRDVAEESTIPQLADADYDTLFGPERR